MPPNEDDDGEGKPTKLFHDLRRTGGPQSHSGGRARENRHGYQWSQDPFCVRPLQHRQRVRPERAVAKLDSYLARKTEATRKGPQREVGTL